MALRNYSAIRRIDILLIIYSCCLVKIKLKMSHTMCMNDQKYITHVCTSQCNNNNKTRHRHNYYSM